MAKPRPGARKPRPCYFCGRIVGSDERAMFALFKPLRIVHVACFDAALANEASRG